MRYRLLKLPARDRRTDHFHIYSSSESHATALCEGMISCAYMVDSGNNLCIRTLSRKDGHFVHTTKIGNRITPNISNPEYPYMKFIHSEEYNSPTIKDFNSPDDLTNALLFKKRSGSLKTFNDLSKIAEKHFREIKREKSTRQSTENILLQNKEGFYALLCFATSSQS